MGVLESLKAELEEVSATYAQAEMELVEVRAKSEKAKIEVAKLRAAIAALEGTSVQEQPRGETVRENTPTGTPTQAASVPTGPYAHIRCSGCGTTGRVQEMWQTSEKTGATVRLIACGECNNVVSMG